MKTLIKNLFQNVKLFFSKRTKKTYRVNFNTNEIHDLRKTHKNCHLALMTNFKDVTEHTAMRMFEKGFNGCRFCLKKHDTG